MFASTRIGHFWIYDFCWFGSKFMEFIFIVGSEKVFFGWFRGLFVGWLIYIFDSKNLTFSNTFGDSKLFHISHTVQSIRFEVSDLWSIGGCRRSKIIGLFLDTSWGHLRTVIAACAVDDCSPMSGSVRFFAIALMAVLSGEQNFCAFSPMFLQLSFLHVKLGALLEISSLWSTLICLNWRVLVVFMKGGIREESSY